MEVGGQRHARAALPPRKIRHPLYRRLGGPQEQSGRVQTILAPTPGFDPRTVQPVASRYTGPHYSVYICSIEGVVSVNVVTVST